MTMLKKIENKNDNPTLSDAQKFVGGYVELVKVKDGILLIDEEGKLKDTPVNVDASKVSCATYGDQDIIVGPAIYIPNNVPSEWHG